MKSNLEKVVSTCMVALLVLSGAAQAFPVHFCAATGHYYEFIPTANTVSWTAASAAAVSEGGYLATVTSPEEQACLEAAPKNSGAYWAGGTDVVAEGVWRWVTGPEGADDFGAGRQFWDGGPSGNTTMPDWYANWFPIGHPATPGGEPNNSGNEDYLSWNTASGDNKYWNDVGFTNTAITGYAIEYDSNPNPGAYWRFEEGVADAIAMGPNSVLDSNGNNHHGTPIGDPVYRISAVPGSKLALEFDGVIDNDVVEITDHPDFQLTQNLTLEACVVIDTFTVPWGQIIFRGHDGPGKDPYFLAVGLPNASGGTSPNATFFIEDRTGGALVTAPVPTSQLLHIAGTLDDATGDMKLFFDGVLQNTTKTAKRPEALFPSPPGPIHVSIGGLRSDGKPEVIDSWQNFDGLIDEVRITAEALDPSQFLTCVDDEPEGVFKEITDGPDEDGIDGTDLVVEVGQFSSTQYEFKVNYSDPDGPPVLIEDTVPAEWNVLLLENDDNKATAALANKRGKGAGATKIDWEPDPAGGMITVWAETREKRRNGKFSPTACGALYLNHGAQVFEIDPATGEPMLDEFGDRLPPILESNQLCLAAVLDVDGNGMIAGDGSGDEDGDGLSDLAEACDVGTDPCIDDTDGDGVLDGDDACPLEAADVDDDVDGCEDPPA